MKPRFLVLPLVALAALQGPVQAHPHDMVVIHRDPTTLMDPAARAVLDRAIQNYQGASGVRFGLETSLNGKAAASSQVRYSTPNQWRIDRKRGAATATTLVNGDDFYE